MADGIHITCLSAHQVAGAVAVIEVKVFHQELSVNRIPHFVQHTLGTDFEVIGNQEAENASHGRHQQKYGHKHRQLVILSAADNVVHDLTADDRINDGESCQKCYEKQSQKEPLSIGLDKGIEPFHWCHRIIPSRMIKKITVAAFPFLWNEVPFYIR